MAGGILYWLKLHKDFFSQKHIKKLRKMAGGDTYTIIYLKMQLLSLQTQGDLYFDGVEDTFEKELALELDEDEENVKMTVLYLKAQGLVEVLTDSEYSLSEVKENIFSESGSTARVRRHRARQKALQCNANVTPSVTVCNEKVTKDIDIDIEKDKNIYVCVEEKKDKKKYTNSFEEFWKAYPRKLNKAEAYKKYQARLKDGWSEEELLSASTNYAKAVLKDRTEERYIKHAKTFLSENTPFTDYLTKQVNTPVTDDDDPYGEWRRQ